MSVDQDDFKMSRSFINRQDHCEDTYWKTKDNECSAEKGWGYIRSIGPQIKNTIANTIFNSL